MDRTAIPNTLKVAYTIDVEAFIGLTEWVNAAVRTPPTTGYWKTRVVSSPELLQPQRRWWDGRVFSLPILVGVDDDHYTVEAEQTPTNRPLVSIEWCGLKAPYPSVYPYRLLSF